MSAAGTTTKKMLDAVKSVGSGSFPIAILLFISAVCIFLIVKYIETAKSLATPDNIRNKLDDAMTSVGTYYIDKSTNRQSLDSYVGTLGNIQAINKVFANFHVSTVNATGLFFPAEDGVFSPDAVRIAVLGGARAFVIDVWPDMSPRGRFAPVVQAVEPPLSGYVRMNGKPVNPIQREDMPVPWNRVSLNALSLNTVISAIMTNVYGSSLSASSSVNYSKDYVVLYLRFQGVPRTSTFQIAANVLQAQVEPYRLDPSFNACRSQDRLLRTPVTDLYGKVIVMSNIRATGSAFEDYINYVPMEGKPIEYSTTDIANMSTNRNIVKGTYSFLAPPVTSKEATANDLWAWKTYTYETGIQCAAMNFFDIESSQLTEYMKPDNFGTYSYKIRQPGNYMVLTSMGETRVSSNPGFGTGQVDVPASIAAP